MILKKLNTYNKNIPENNTMSEDSENVVSVTVKSLKRQKITTETDLSEEPNKDQLLVKMFCVDLGPYYIHEESLRRTNS